MTEPVVTPADALPRFRYEWSPGRYVRMARAMGRHGPARWNGRAWWVLVLGVLLWPAAGRLRGGDSLGTVLADQLPVALVVVALLILYEAVRWIMAWRFCRGPHGRSEFVLWLSDDGVETDTYSGRSTLRWQALRAVVETRAFLLFYVTTFRAVGMPLAAIPDDGTRDDVRREIKARVGDRARLRG